MKRLGLLSLVAILLSASAIAGTHPVPLDAKTDSSKCLECHEDKNKGKSVHSAMAMGCTSCHEVRVNRDITRVKLVSTTSAGVCLTCHGDKKAADLKGKVHPPAVRDCIKCHDPHVSENKNQLRHAMDGDSRESNLCLSCHNEGKPVEKGGSRHAALDMGCNTCHTTHKTGTRGQREFDQHLVKDAPALCLDCHDAKQASLVKAHQDQPFATADCLTCHNPHQSRTPKLMQAFQHMPFQGRDCNTCHAAAKEGKVVLTTPEAKSTCVTCHSDKAEQIEKASVQHPGAMSDCTTCHNPHASKEPGLPAPNGVAACTSCHSDQAELQKTKAHLHQAAFEQGCATCHEPHGSQNKHLLRASSTNALCLECHGPETQPKKIEADHLVTIFENKVRLPENYFAKVPTLPIKYGLGHPVEGHPVADVMDPSDTSKVLKPMNCLSCHQPHASTNAGLLTKDQENNGAFCASCHQGFTK